MYVNPTAKTSFIPKNVSFESTRETGIDEEDTGIDEESSVEDRELDII